VLIRLDVRDCVYDFFSRHFGHLVGIVVSICDTGDRGMLGLSLVISGADEGLSIHRYDISIIRNGLNHPFFTARIPNPYSFDGTRHHKFFFFLLPITRLQLLAG
jgi:hypothetical protein